MPKKLCYRLKTHVNIENRGGIPCCDGEIDEGPNSCSKAKCKFSTVANMAGMMGMSAAQTGQWTDYTSGSISMVCDICGQSISISAMKTVEPGRIVAVTKKGFAPTELPLVPAGKTVAEVWKHTVSQNQTVNWGLCGECGADVEHFERTGEPRPPKPWWKFW